MYVSDPSDALDVSIGGDDPRITYTATIYYFRVKALDKAKSKKMEVDLIGYFEEQEFSKVMTFDLTKGTLNGQGIFDIGTFELIDENQWRGEKPYSIPTRHKQNSPAIPFADTPPLWSIATVNAATGERVVLILSHCRKDRLFTILNRVNAILAYARQVCAPFQDLLDAGQPIPVDELREDLDAHPPRFKFTPLERSPPLDAFFIERSHLPPVPEAPPAPPFDIDPIWIKRGVRAAIAAPIIALLVWMGYWVDDSRFGCDGIGGYEWAPENCERLSFLPWVVVRDR